MSTTDGPEAHDRLFQADDEELKHAKPKLEHIPDSLIRASLRLQFPPTYVVIGVYRLFTDKRLYEPAWQKCRNGTRRGLSVGAAWVVFTFELQRKFIELFLANSKRVTGLSNETIFGFTVPFSLTTCAYSIFSFAWILQSDLWLPNPDAAVLLMGSQLTIILRFFLSRNIGIARDRAWAQTVASRGKGPDFWQPYVEEWEIPPKVKPGPAWERVVTKLSGGLGLFVIRRAILLPFNFYPFVGILVTAAFKSLRTAQILHKPYFESKKMDKKQIAVFVEERKWDYRLFGFAAALLEGLPIIGLAFTISNRIGAAMWAHDLEKRQHFVATERANRSAAAIMGAPISGVGKMY
ncbi:hypothetical protein H0H81_008758 [Sphagnurus paluster]|uniref:Uncharacterized protein n=1 Tax=Sphagnurus paluster TaxID=117069 RepID=A0A9P7GQ23_9AGAR|nr:hypothetical protein H0H81_008758 [Sphagnurus paluster]